MSLREKPPTTLCPHTRRVNYFAIDYTERLSALLLPQPHVEHCCPILSKLTHHIRRMAMKCHTLSLHTTSLAGYIVNRQKDTNCVIYHEITSATFQLSFVVRASVGWLPWIKFYRVFVLRVIYVKSIAIFDYICLPHRTLAISFKQNLSRSDRETKVKSDALPVAQPLFFL